MAVSGYAADNSLRVVAILDLEAGTEGSVRVHEGYSCESAGEPMTGPEAQQDLWSAAKFISDEFGNVELNALVENIPLSSVVGRTLVVELSTGERAACAVIGTESAGLCLQLPPHQHTWNSIPSME